MVMIGRGRFTLLAFVMHTFLFFTVLVFTRLIIVIKMVVIGRIGITLFKRKMISSAISSGRPCRSGASIIAKSNCDRCERRVVYKRISLCR